MTAESLLTLLAIGDQVLLSLLDHCDVPQGLAELQCGPTEILGVHRTTELEHKTTITENQVLLDTGLTGGKVTTQPVHPESQMVISTEIRQWLSAKGVESGQDITGTKPSKGLILARTLELVVLRPD